MDVERQLQQIADGQAHALVVERLSEAANSLGELVRLLDWLDGAGATLTAHDVGLDTSTPSGRATIAVLKEIEGWERPRGRPGLKAADPKLVERIAAMRDRGLSLQSIAEHLNAEGVPTPRGGQKWRPSSVQSALGYRRPPRPPGPPHPPHHPGPRHRPPPPPDHR